MCLRGVLGVPSPGCSETLQRPMPAASSGCMHNDALRNTAAVHVVMSATAVCSADRDRMRSVPTLLLHPIKLEQDTWPLFHH